ncbi:SusC/RagA family TonB-linked outer membrane protein [Capnocytophaga felis]|uniref:SusC/RagA family TonB-linked outer membrane protein n=1 Tax=Capnocytophaga felis TaxID=2267611 RepID=A0A5M4B9T0_9FLAO|nr:TonB-dependent receptor [Capnocytophaga felis]GET46361.1 SusC/RagA family TonB-linked outer membrane protein [Capnocytophaga felis]GET48191.1 SusC/RagA family TonB-linked outer membrane protein [Capnocytophaga felis]
MQVKILTLLAFVFGWALSPIIAQTLLVKGNVTDGNGVPLPGVGVVIKGTSKGVATDFDGNYEIQTKSGDVLEFSSLGYQVQTKKVSGSNKVLIINVKLVEEASQIDEVVVIGHGTQKKVSVSGAVATVKGGELRSPSSSLTSAFAGQLAGVFSSSRSGEPGSAAEFYIRGISTFGGRTTPLILLDDVEISATDLDNIPAETIESFSVLKDASATAIYGSRGSNGVMVIKTKNGNRNEKTKIGITYDQSFNTPINFPKFVDGATWMELFNEALLTRNPSAPIRYSQERIDATRSGVNPYVYPDVNWEKVLFRDMAVNKRANINIQGGGDKATYYMSIQANNDEGLLRTQKIYSWDNNINRWAYNFQNNITYNLSESSTIELRMNAQIRQTEGPNFERRGDHAPNVNLTSFFGQILASNPINFPVYYPQKPGDEHFKFGSSVVSGNNFKSNPFANMNTGFHETRSNTINTALKLKQKFDFITKGLSMSMLINFKNWSQNSYHRFVDPYIYRVKEGSYNPVTQEYETERLGTGGSDYITTSAKFLSGDQTFDFNTSVDYDRKFGENHNVTGMLLYRQREYKEGILPHRNQSISGRFTYNFGYKYFAEFSFGYTGTERLPKGDRFEFFPSGAIGWAVSKEDFFAPLENVISFLKLRSTYGLTGSDETGGPHFLYIGDVRLDNIGYTTGESLGFRLSGPEVLGWPVRNARWEKSLQFNIGADIKFFKDALSLTADYYTEDRYDIMLKREAWPQSLGYHAAKPHANKGKVYKWGYEFGLDWQQKVTDSFSFRINSTFSYTQNKYVDVDDPVYKYPWQSRTNKPLSHIEGFIADGLFTSQEEIDNSPKQNLGSIPMPGDIKYRDINGDGLITDDDKTMISPYGRAPRIQYGFGINLFYKKFDFNAQFNGQAKRTITTGLLAPFGEGDRHVFQYIADNRWTESNPNPNAAYPRLGLQTSDIANNNQSSTFWMRDGSFLRWKALEVGYKFKFGRVYVRGENIAMFSSFKQWDPELHWSTYPLQRMYNLGVQLNF